MLFMVVPRKRVCPSHSLAYHDLTQSIALYGKTAITGSGGDNAIHGRPSQESVSLAFSGIS